MEKPPGKKNSKRILNFSETLQHKHKKKPEEQELEKKKKFERQRKFGVLKNAVSLAKEKVKKKRKEKKKEIKERKSTHAVKDR